jgi:hypothetical protein
LRSGTDLHALLADHLLNKQDRVHVQGKFWVNDTYFLVPLMYGRKLPKQAKIGIIFPTELSESYARILTLTPAETRSLDRTISGRKILPLLKKLEKLVAAATTIPDGPDKPQQPTAPESRP